MTGALVMWLEQQNFLIRETEKDGNCLFATIVNQLDVTGLDNYTKQDLRMQTCMFMAEHADAMLKDQAYNISAEHHGVRAKSYKDYVSHMTKNAVYGDAICIMAIIYMFGVSINLFNVGANRAVLHQVNHRNQLGDVDLYMILQKKHYSGVRKLILIPF